MAKRSPTLSVTNSAKFKRYQEVYAAYQQWLSKFPSGSDEYHDVLKLMGSLKHEMIYGDKAEETKPWQDYHDHGTLEWLNSLSPSESSEGDPQEFEQPLYVLDLESVLTDRQFEVLQLVADGSTREATASYIGVSSKGTVNFHFATAKEKLQTRLQTTGIQTRFQWEDLLDQNHQAQERKPDRKVTKPAKGKRKSGVTVVQQHLSIV